MTLEETSTVSTDWSGDGFRIPTLHGGYDPASWEHV
jgi:hypothetical protein